MEKSHVCLTQCPLCGTDSGVAIHNQVKKVFNYSDRISAYCNQCEELLNRGAVLFIEIRDGESKDNPYRTGNIIWLSKEFKERNNIDSQVNYIEASIAIQMGLPMGKEINNITTG